MARSRRGLPAKLIDFWRDAFFGVPEIDGSGDWRLLAEAMGRSCGSSGRAGLRIICGGYWMILRLSSGKSILP